MARFEKTITLVQCSRLNEELPALERRPFPGELGQRIYDNVSKLAYKMWQEQATLLINHYGLNMADPNAQQFLFEQMEAFLLQGEGDTPPDWTPAGGAPAPRKK